MPSPTSVPSNVRNGRLFAGAHAPRPRFLPLLAGPSFDGSGIEPESCAANGGVREGATTGSETQHPAIASGSGFKPPHYRLQRKKTGPVCSQRRPAGESKACFAEPPQSKRRIPLRRKPAKAPVLAQPSAVPAKATCGWFWCYLLPPKGSYTPRTKAAVDRRPKSGNNPESSDDPSVTSRERPKWQSECPGCAKERCRKAHGRKRRYLFVGIADVAAKSYLCAQNSSRKKCAYPN